MRRTNAEKVDIQTRMAAVDKELRERGIDPAAPWWEIAEQLLSALDVASRLVDLEQQSLRDTRDVLERAKETALIWAQQATIRNFEFDETLHADIGAIIGKIGDLPPPAPVLPPEWKPAPASGRWVEHAQTADTGLPGMWAAVWPDGDNIEGPWCWSVSAEFATRPPAPSIEEAKEAAMAKLMELVAGPRDVLGVEIPDAEADHG